MVFNNPHVKYPYWREWAYQKLQEYVDKDLLPQDIRDMEKKISAIIEELFEVIGIPIEHPKGRVVGVEISFETFKDGYVDKESVRPRLILN
jgi:hypothetical protein